MQSLFLIQNFNDLYVNLVMIKAEIISGNWASNLNVNSFNEEAIKKMQAIADYINELLSIQQNESEKINQLYVFLKYKYIACALCDEMFLNIKWKNVHGIEDISHMWLNCSLEMRNFQTNNAGVQIYKNIEDLLTSYDFEHKKDLAFLYLYLLGIGFQGGGNVKLVQTYKSKLYNFIYNEKNIMYASDKLYSDIYDVVLTGQMKTRPKETKVTYIVSFCLFIYTCASYVIWSRSTAPLFKLINQAVQYLSGDFA